jgi:hypothetical protein
MAVKRTDAGLEAARKAAADAVREMIQKENRAKSGGAAEDIRSALKGAPASGGLPDAGEVRKILGASGGAAGQPQKSEPADEYPSFDDYFNGSGYLAAQEAGRRALEEYIDQIVRDIGSQKRDVEREAAEMARQAYIGYMQSKNALPQSLAARGYTGGMADSQHIGLETALQNSRRQIEQSKTDTLNALDLAAANARSEAGREAAQRQSEIALAASKAWSDYVSASRSGERTGGESAGSPEPPRSRAFQWVLDMIGGGTLPDDAILGLPGLTPSERRLLERLVSAEEWMR